jgi:RNA polymerase sigma-70 factor (ECF subfamily)
MLPLDTPAARSNLSQASATAAANADYQLVRVALGGEPAALMALVGRLTPIIKARVARSLYRGLPGAMQQEVADMTQDVFVRLLGDRGRALRAWDPAQGLTLEGFVRLVAQREVASIMRCKRRAPFEQDPRDPLVLDEQPLSCRRSLDSEIAGREHFDLLVARLGAQLTPRALELFQRLFVELQAPAEVALALDLSLDAVYQWRSRLAKTVRDNLAAARAESTPPPPPRRSARPS